MPIVTTPGQQASRIQATTDSVTTSPLVQPPLPPIIPSVPVVSQQSFASEDTQSVPPIPAFEDDDEDLGDNYAPTPTPIATNRSQAGAVALSRMSEDERRRIITATFQLVLGREPTDRDFSYYRFSTLTEEGLTKSLLALPEHKQLVEKAREHTMLKQSVNDLDLRVKQLDTSVQSMRQELQTLEYLLAEKNRYIQQMRGIPPEKQVPLPIQPQPVQPQQLQSSATPMGVQSPAPQQIPQAQSQSSPDIQTTTLPTPVDEVKSLFKGFFGKK